MATQLAAPIEGDSEDGRARQKKCAERGGEMRSPENRRAEIAETRQCAWLRPHKVSHDLQTGGDVNHDRR